MTQHEGAKQHGANPLLKLALELGPLLIFFLANSKPDLFRPLLTPVLPASLLAGENAGIFTATAVFMIAMAISLALTWRLLHTLPVMPLVSGIVVLVLGTLTLALADDMFIKIKPTIVNLFFGAVLLGGLAFGKLLLPYVLNGVFDLDPPGWRKLTLRWGLFFLFLAVLNEAIWRTQTRDFWVAFKVWGTMPITFLFAIAQTPLILKHTPQEKAEDGKP